MSTRTRAVQQLRWQGRCCVCLAELGAGELGRYDPAQREITCSRCASEVSLIDRPVPPARPTARRSRPADRDREHIRSLIAEARAKLDAARQAG